MAETLEFVYDRTSRDVFMRTSKGYINASDLNRIEGNEAYIGEKLGCKLETKEWAVGDIPRYSDYERILNNTQAIRDSIAVLSTTPQVPDHPVNDYEKWNDIERILYDVWTLYNSGVDTLLYCGEIFTGEGGVV